MKSPPEDLSEQNDDNGEDLIDVKDHAKDRRYVQNLPYMHHDENSFRKSQISVTHSLAFQDILKLLLYCYRYTTTTILFKLQLHNIITTIL